MYTIVNMQKHINKMKIKITNYYINTMNTAIERYLKEIRNIVPSYEGARRGRGQCSLLSSLSKEDRKQFMFLERKLRFN